MIDGDDVVTANEKSGEESDDSQLAQANAVGVWLSSIDIAKAIEEAKFAKGSAPRSVHYPADKLFKAGKDDSAGEVESDEDGDSD